MCTISGGVFLNTYYPADDHAAAELLEKVIIRGALRGRDSWGIATASDELSKSETVVKELGSSENSNFDFKTYFEKCIHSGRRKVLINNRAMPTTESQQNVPLEDCQPFTIGRWTIVHNGTIANDRELRKWLENIKGIEFNSSVDSEVIAGLCEAYLQDKLCDESQVDFKELMLYLSEKLVGSYAIGIMLSDVESGNFLKDSAQKMGLMCNYKPIYVEMLKDRKGCIFTSLQDDLGTPKEMSFSRTLMSQRCIFKMPAYSGLVICGDESVLTGEISLQEFSLVKPIKRKKTLVVCSGGLDSTVVATYCVRRGDDVTLLHFQYGCMAEEREQSAVTRVANALKCNVIFFNNTATTREIGGSTLLDPNAKIADMKEGAEYAHEWVPARNLIMLANAVGYAEAHGFDTIALGVNLEESGAYPDNEMIFIQMLNQVLPYATQNGHHVNIEMPVGHLVKHEIVSLGHKLHAPFADSWSCYTNHTDHCGKCGPCGMRKAAFHIAKVEDPTIYEDNSLYNDLNKEE